MGARQSETRTVFVSFSGIDGAGKSTQIQALRARMREAGLRVRVIAFWDEIARLTSLREGAGHQIFNGDKGVGSPEAPINRRDKNVRSWPMTLLRLGFYLVDAVSVRRVVKQALHSGTDFVIFDRYIYDELANLPLRNPFIRWFVKAIARFVPRPDVSYILDADPIKARTRKPEYPLEFIYINRRSYIELGELLGCMTVISPGPIDEVARDVLKHALDTLAMRMIAADGSHGSCNSALELEDRHSRPASTSAGRS